MAAYFSKPESQVSEALKQGPREIKDQNLNLFDAIKILHNRLKVQVSCQYNKQCMVYWWSCDSEKSYQKSYHHS